MASDFETVDVLNLESPKSTKDGLNSVDEGNGLVVNMAAGSIIGVEGNNGLIVDQPLTSGFSRVGIGDLHKCEVKCKESEMYS